MSLKEYAFWAVLGGCMIMTSFLGISTWYLREQAQFLFYLALAAHAQILVGMTALGALLVKRTIKVGTDGVEISDSDPS